VRRPTTLWGKSTQRISTIGTFSAPHVRFDSAGSVAWALAQVGPFTAVFEALAAAVGAGIVLGGFALGIYRLTTKHPREELEARVLMDGYAGGLVGVLVTLIDLVVRYGGG
jgi:hypothetical protein